MFPTLTENEFVSIKSAVAKLAEAWLNTPLASQHPTDWNGDAETEARRKERMAALRVQLDALGLPHIGRVTNLGQLQCVTRFLAQNIAMN